jgi:hypothetical protein
VEFVFVDGHGGSGRMPALTAGNVSIANSTFSEKKSSRQE